MEKEKPKGRKEEYFCKEGELDKQSSSVFLGFQKKFWKILENGSKIGYRNINQLQFKPDHTFQTKFCQAQEISHDVFELKTEIRNFRLKASDQFEKDSWIKTITFLRKEMFKPKKKKNEPSPTETTMATMKQKVQRTSTKGKKKQALFITNSKITKFNPADMTADLSQFVVDELTKYLPKKYVKYNTMVTNLKKKNNNLIINSFKEGTYILISPKSLYPDVHINDENLTNKSLPPWLQINTLYKISQNKQKNRLVLKVDQILDIEQIPASCSFKINTGETIYEYFANTLFEMECICNCLQVARDNASEVIVNSNISKYNYDAFIDLHETQIEKFQQQARNLVGQLIPDQNTHKYEPEVFIDFIEASVGFLTEFIAILEQKKKNKNHVILEMLIIFHEEVKIQTKLTWDSSFHTIKSINILKILQALSQYYDVVNPFIKSIDLFDGMKELSKIYVRMSWKNFQNIIHNTVEQEKKDNFYQDESTNYLSTNGITDLFSFMYRVFDLAHPHWKNKVHLHNVNRLMLRALNIFLSEIKSMINQQILPQKQLIALSNNYFRFKECVNEFYQDKFVTLTEKTKDSYDRVINTYKEISLIIVEKLCRRVHMSLSIDLEGKTFLTANIDIIVKTIFEFQEIYGRLLHISFVRKLNQNLVMVTHRKLIQLLCKDSERKSQAKIKIKDFVDPIKKIKLELAEIFAEVSMQPAFKKNMSDIEYILLFDSFRDLENIIESCPQPMRSQYIKIMELRDDFSKDSLLKKKIISIEENPRRRKTKQKNRKSSADIGKYVKSFYEEDQEDKNSQKSQSKKSNSQHVEKLISEGYMIKGKPHQKVWEKQYFRLRSGFLYIYENQDSQKCCNSIDLKKMLRLDVHDPAKASFLLTYRNLGKDKQIKLKCQSKQERDRWVNSLQLEKRRLENQKQIKKKAIRLKQNGRKKNQLIIDYEQIQRGKDYFSYSI